MKLRAVFALLSLSAAVTSYGQHSCCTAKGNTIEALASNASFQAAHRSPLPLNYNPQHGATVSFPTGDGKTGSAYFIHAAKPTKNVLIVCHEWWGLNDYIKREAEAWQSQLGDVEVYAMDLYDGKSAATPEEAGKLMGALDPVRATEIVKGLLAKIGEGKNIVTLGWCMGGSWSFQTALHAGTNAKACVMYYGFPEEDQKKISMLKTDVLYIYGTKDAYIKKDVVEQFGKRVEATGNKFTRIDYDAVHAFANPSNPDYDKKNADDAQVKAIAFLKKGMQ